MNKARESGDLADSRIEEALYLSASEYRSKYGARKTWIDLPGGRVVLEDIFAAARERTSVPYRTVWQRVRRLKKSFELTEESLAEALTLSTADWRSFYGGGRHSSFEYSGELFPAHFGQIFHSRAAFLKTIGRYEDRSTVWSRLKAGWDLDAALIEPVVNEVNRTGLIYRVTRRSTKQVYIGLTILTLDGRWAQHLASVRKGSTTKLSQAIAEDGADGFDLDVLEDGIVDADNLKKREQYWVGKLGALGPNGLNTRPAGSLGLRRGKKIEFEGEKFSSIVEAAETISRRTGLAPHVVASRLSAGEALPARARIHSRHSEAGSNLFRIWLGLKKRHPGAVDQRWVDDFDSFKEDVARTRVEGHELVRKDSSQPWSLENFEWVSTQEKIARTHGREVTAFGKTYPTLKAAAIAHGIGASTLKYRLARGMSPEQALGSPLGVTSYRNGQRDLTLDGRRFRSKRQAILHISSKEGISESQAKQRLEKHLSGGGAP